MGKVKKAKDFVYCQKTSCGNKIPDHKRSDTKYCTTKCKEAEEKKRYCVRNPDYVKRQRRLVREIRHNDVYGHTDFLDDPLKNTNDKYRHARAMGYRSGLEVTVARQLEALNIPFDYEKFKIKYEVHEVRTYSPDYVLPNSIIVETKGRFVTADRKKHLLVREQHPELDIRFVFSNSKAKISKGSKTSYADWCNKYKFQFADKLIPQEWLDEVPKCSN
jgi:hypothetical protein